MFCCIRQARESFSWLVYDRLIDRQIRCKAEADGYSPDGRRFGIRVAHEALLCEATRLLDYP